MRIDLEYIGTRYAGLQWQENALTIQQVVEGALDKLTSEHSRLTAAGRTDAGVHALYQPTHADVTTSMSDEELARGLNSILPNDIVVTNVTTVADDWSARFSAKEKTYHYTILNRERPSAFDHGRVWHIRKPLDIEAMRSAGKLLVGEHDFASFRSSGCKRKSTVRNLDRLTIERDADYILFVFTARSFLKQMVRNIVGTLLEVGLGKIAPEDIVTILEACDRTKAGPCAPPDGLCLMSVDYS